MRSRESASMTKVGASIDPGIYYEAQKDPNHSGSDFRKSVVRLHPREAEGSTLYSLEEIGDVDV